MGAVAPDRPADGRAGREDHQGPRPGGDVAVRAVHRRLHRHRAGVEGSRAAQHLQPAREAGAALGARARQVRRPRADARRQPRRDDGGRCTSCSRGCAWGQPPEAAQRRGRRRPLDPRLLVGRVPDLRAADARHRDRAVLLDVLRARCWRRSSPSGCSSPGISAPTCALRVSRAIAGRRRRSRAGLYYVLPNLALFDVKAAVVHGAPVPAGRVALRRHTRLLYIAALLLACDASSSRGATFK